MCWISDSWHVFVHYHECTANSVHASRISYIFAICLHTLAGINEKKLLPNVLSTNCGPLLSGIVKRTSVSGRNV